MATSIQCPRCQHPISIKDPRPGRFRIECPKCAGPFALKVAADPGAIPTVEAIEPAPAAPAFDPDETVSHENPAKVAATPSPSRPPDDDTTIDEKRVAFNDLDPPFQPPRSLGGYRTGRRLGPTRVGAIFEGRRKATGRNVALTVVKPRWSALAAFVSRFAREAFAASKLEHPNLIAPGDFDVIKGFPVVASDALGGETLSDPKGREGLDRTARVAAILHAARGLRHAHEQGIYHRDLSLEKIRVDPSGLVRLAGIGAGLTPETPESPNNPAIPLSGPPGSAPPPPPEPLATGFVRDDIAGLGRALQSLVGGSKGDRALPPGLASLVRKLTGDAPDGPFTDLGALVRTMEVELGVSGPFAPRGEEAAELEGCVRAFGAPPLVQVRPRVALGFAAVFGLFVAIALLFGRPITALGTIGFVGLVGASLVAIRGLLGRDPLFDRVRELSLGGTLGDVLTLVAVAALLVVALAVAKLLGFGIFLALLAIGLASAYHFAVDRPIEQARTESIARATALIQGLRRLGVDEEAVRRFACQQAGPRWEEFFEHLFGYDALRSARKRWGLDAGGKRRPRFARWRDPIIAAIDAKLGARKREHDRILFQAIEERNLEARGINLLTARRKSRRIAEALVQYAHQHRQSNEDAGPPLMEALNRVAHRPEDYLATAETEENTGPPAWKEALGFATRLLFGPRTRFLLGGVLLAGGLYWVHQNLITAEELKQVGMNAFNDREQGVAEARKLAEKLAAKVQDVAKAGAPTKDLELQGLSPEVSRRVDGFGLGVAGLILVLSAMFQGTRIAAFAIPGALIAAFGPQLIEAGARPLGPTSLIAIAIGGGLFALGVVFGRGRD